MKTLDEVIELMEGMDFISWGADALHYLKEYRTEQKTLSDSKEHYEYWEHKYYAELEKNDPLTWDELKTMEGKPVWLECMIGHREENAWRICLHVDRPECGCEDAMYTIAPPCYRKTFKKSTIGKTWQAYRKERSS